ncbi:MAG TPA: Crp/Fnr family transcriptional regulator [Candidatus Limnocylindria bacterium]|nr:Crp/Fnr family transcriptional regulator [Candidatus Limnocylindria bacterium]
MADDPTLGLLLRCPLFTGAEPDDLQEVVRHVRRRRFRRGEVIFHEGDPADALHVVASGAVKIVLSSDEGDEAIIATLHPGDFFGELSLLDGSPRSATAAAVEATETVSLPRDTFLEEIGRSARLRDCLLRSLAAELRRLTGHVEELHFLDLSGRLASRLVRLAQEADPPPQRTEDGRVEARLEWPFTQSDLAAMIGATRQSVNRLLVDLVDRGLVRIERETLVIPDLERLEQLAVR